MLSAQTRQRPTNGTFIGHQEPSYDRCSMDRSEPPARVPISAEWLAEQERKQAAYAAVRRARSARWEGPREAEPEPEDVPVASPASAVAEPPTSPAGRRPRGPIADPRQARLF